MKDGTCGGHAGKGAGMLSARIYSMIAGCKNSMAWLTARKQLSTLHRAHGRIAFWQPLTILDTARFARDGWPSTFLTDWNSLVCRHFRPFPVPSELFFFISSLLWKCPPPPPAIAKRLAWKKHRATLYTEKIWDYKLTPVFEFLTV